MRKIRAKRYFSEIDGSLESIVLLRRKCCQFVWKSLVKFKALRKKIHFFLMKIIVQSNWQLFDLDAMNFVNKEKLKLFFFFSWMAKNQKGQISFWKRAWDQMQKKTRDISQLWFSIGKNANYFSLNNLTCSEKLSQCVCNLWYFLVCLKIAPIPR